MLEFSFPHGGPEQWDVTITGSLFAQNGLGTLGAASIPMLGMGSNPLPLGVVIGPPSTDPYTLNIVDVLAGQDFYLADAFVAKVSLFAPPLTGARSLYLLYDDVSVGGIPFSVLIYEVKAELDPGIRTKLGTKKGFFLS